jgi:hypothetical protein
MSIVPQRDSTHGNLAQRFIAGNEEHGLTAYSPANSSTYESPAFEKPIRP